MNVWNEWRNTEHLKWGRTYPVSSNLRVGLELLTYLLTPWCRVLLDKVTGLQLVKKFPAYHETRRFITALTHLRQPSLSWTSPIKSIYPHPTSWRSILILSTHLRQVNSFPPGSTPRPYTLPLSSPISATCPGHLILLDFTTRTMG